MKSKNQIILKKINEMSLKSTDLTTPGWLGYFLFSRVQEQWQLVITKKNKIERLFKDLYKHLTDMIT